MIRKKEKKKTPGDALQMQPFGGRGEKKKGKSVLDKMLLFFLLELSPLAFISSLSGFSAPFTREAHDFTVSARLPSLP